MDARSWIRIFELKVYVKEYYLTLMNILRDLWSYVQVKIH